MLATERRRKIMELIQTEGSILVSELSKRFHVTEETIRRDLDKLESEGKVIRTHGGAIINDTSPAEIPVKYREVERLEQKRAIAKEAVKFIQAKDCIALDASTTAWQMAKILPDLPITVVTNSVKVVMELANKENIQVVSLGGTLVSRSLSFVGPLTERSIEGYHVQKCFLSCRGLHLQHGLSELTEEQARVKEKMIQNADKVILLVDSSKFGVRSFTRIVGLEAINTLITDHEADAEIVEAVRKIVPNVRVADTRK